MKNSYKINGDETVIDIQCQGEPMEAIIDTENLEKVSKFDVNWRAVKSGNTYYLEWLWII